MILKQVIHFLGANAVEVTWVNVISPAKTIPAQTIPASIDPLTGAQIPAQVIPEQHIPAVEEVVRCHTYMDVQMDMLVADLGADAPKYADLIAKVKAGIKPSPEVPLPDLRATALAKLPAWEGEEKSKGIDHAGRKWLTTPAALQDIRDALLAGMVPGGVWIDASRQPVPMTLSELQALWAACVTRGAAIYQRRLEMEQSIATMPRAELEAFKPGWPAKP